GRLRREQAQEARHRAVGFSPDLPPLESRGAVRRARVAGWDRGALPRPPVAIVENYWSESRSARHGDEQDARAPRTADPASIDGRGAIHRACGQGWQGTAVP